jgi:hypothetical protein
MRQNPEPLHFPFLLIAARLFLILAIGYPSTSIYAFSLAGSASKNPLAS